MKVLHKIFLKCTHVFRIWITCLKCCLFRRKWNKCKYCGIHDNELNSKRD